MHGPPSLSLKEITMRKQTVWMVTWRDWYDNTQVIGVYQTESSAQKALSEHIHPEWGDIEEIEVQ